jgi:hypothetical protein
MAGPEGERITIHSSVLPHNTRDSTEMAFHLFHSEAIFIIQCGIMLSWLIDELLCGIIETL